MNQSVKAIFAVILIAQLAPSTFAQSSVEWTPGSIFTFVEQDAWKKEIGRWNLTIKSKDESGYSVIESRADQETQIRVNNMGVYTRPKPGSSETFDYSPVKLPISTGSSWEWSYHYIGRTTGAPGLTTRKCEAENMEEVEVPAGKFKAWKIGCKGSWQAGGYSGTNNRTMWYSPELSVVLKTDERTWTSGGSDRTIFFLESFSRK